MTSYEIGMELDKLPLSRLHELIDHLRFVYGDSFATEEEARVMKDDKSHALDVLSKGERHESLAFIAAYSADETAATSGKPKPLKQQKIRLRLYKHPIKLDGVVKYFAPDGSYIIVSFDGPLPDAVFWNYSEHLVTDKRPIPYTAGSGGLQLADGSKLWEVL